MLYAYLKCGSAAWGEWRQQRRMTNCEDLIWRQRRAACSAYCRLNPASDLGRRRAWGLGVGGWRFRTNCAARGEIIKRLEQICEIFLLRETSSFLSRSSNKHSSSIKRVLPKSISRISDQTSCIGSIPHDTYGSLRRWHSDRQSINQP
jgi:hypothetical protein